MDFSAITALDDKDIELLYENYMDDYQDYSEIIAADLCIYCPNGANWSQSFNGHRGVHTGAGYFCCTAHGGGCSLSSKGWNNKWCWANQHIYHGGGGWRLYCWMTDTNSSTGTHLWDRYTACR